MPTYNTSTAVGYLGNLVNSLVTGVSSVFGRTGAVTATAGDYTASKISNDSSSGGTYVSNALNTLWARTITAGNGLTGGGDLSANRTLTVLAADSSISVGAGGISTSTTAIGAVPTARTITAGNGLTGGGDLSANRTLTAVAADASLTVSSSGISAVLQAVAESTTARTLGLSDAYKTVDCSNGSATTVTVPPNSSVAFAVGTVIYVAQLGAGQVTIAPGSGVTLNAPDGKKKTRVQYSVLMLRKTATDTWLITGDGAA